MAQKFLAPFKNIHGFKKGHEPKKGKLASDLFQYAQCGDIGFPERPTSLAYDSSLDLVALGTADGVIKVLGKPDVEFISTNPAHSEIRQISFIPYQGRIVTLCGNNQLLLWELKLDNKGLGTLNLTKTIQLPNEREQDAATCMCVDGHRKIIFVGLMSGNISVVRLSDSFVLATDESITVDRVTSGLRPEVQGELHFGSVAGLALNPRSPHIRLLIGYSLGAAVVWRMDRQKVERVIPGPQQALESVTWQTDNRHMLASYADGSYMQWLLDVEEDEEEEDDSNVVLRSDSPPAQPYGPFPCKAISRLLWRPSAEADAQPFLIFSGGMPRASFGDRHTVSVIREPDQVCFDFTSPVVDFVTVDEKSGQQEAHTLLVLLEEELVSIDLKTEDWPLIEAPYLCALHSSAITTVRMCDNVPSELLQHLEELGRRQRLHPYSPRSWPVNGGHRVVNDGADARHLLLTGHEDGSVSMWAIGGNGGTRRMLTLHTSTLYHGDFPANEPGQHEQEETWPPFRRTGVFDPYSDDPRLAVKQLELAVEIGSEGKPKASLAVGGAAGQLSVWDLYDVERQVELDVSKVLVDIMPKAEQAQFEWKGPESLSVKEGELSFPAGFQPSAVAQVEPTACVTAVAINPAWGLLAAGTAHGLCVIDTRNARAAFSRCTVPLSVLSNPQQAGMGTGTMRSMTMTSRGLTLKKSLRNSFRRLRKLRSSRREKSSVEAPAAPSGDATQENSRTLLDGSVASTTGATVDGCEDNDREHVSVERSVEARPGLDSCNAAIIRCLLFAETSVVPGGPYPCLLAGSNAGTAMLHVIRVPSPNESGEVVVELRKELQLHHRAPILHLAVIDARSPFLPLSASTPASSGDHDLLVVSEEQAKLFSLPQLRPRHKAKLTALDGNRLKRAGVQHFRFSSSGDGEESMTGLSVVNAAGQVVVLSLPNLRRLGLGEAISPNDVVGVNSVTVLQPCPLGLYQSAPGQISLFTMGVLQSLGMSRAGAVELPTRARPAEETGGGKEEGGENGGRQSGSGNGVTSISRNTVSGTTTPDVEGEVRRRQEQEVEAEVAAAAGDRVEQPTQNRTTTESGDISLLLGGDVTIDSIKEYVAKHGPLAHWGGEGEPVVKRTELVLERQTLIAGGQVTTTTTEKEVVDGRTVREETTTSSAPVPSGMVTTTVTSQADGDGD